MTWQLQYTHAISSNADHHSFHEYFFDTYLNGKSQFTVTAHPDGSAFKRSIKVTYPNVYDNGNPTSMYFWVNWQSTTNPTYIYWYMDMTYTTLPGDLGTYASASQACSWIGNFNAQTSSNIKIWQSSERTDACLVTMGKRIMFFWPGCSEWGVTEPIGIGTWDGSGPIPGQGWFFPYIGSSQAMQIKYSVQYSTASTANSYLVPNWGFQYQFMNAKFSDGPVILTGFPWDLGSGAYELYQQSLPYMSKTSTDVGQWIPTPSMINAGDDYWVVAVASADGELVLDTNTNNYWLCAYPNQTASSCSAYNFGTSEPDFS